MLYDGAREDTLFADGRPPREDMHEVLRWARERIGLNGSHPWRLLSARRKMGKTLFEIEESTDHGPRRLIGKLCKAERADVLDRALRSLWSAGFCPPARHTVTEAIAILPERGFILQERAPGVDGRTLVLRGGDEALRASHDAAEWLAALHRAPVRACAGMHDPDTIGRWVRELSEAVPDEARRLGRIEDAVLRELADLVTDTVPSHGDFHPMNIFIHTSGDVGQAPGLRGAPGPADLQASHRITGIDLDKFSQREPEFDVGYYLAQTAAFGYFATGAMDSTAEARRAFLDRYRETSGREVRARRAGMHAAITFLKNLHYDLVLLKTERVERAAPWLASAEAAILEDDLGMGAT